MRIYSDDSDKTLLRVTFYLTFEEAKEVKDSLEGLLNKNHHHAHIPDEDFKREITVCVYRESNLSSFDERSKKFILEDE